MFIKAKLSVTKEVIYINSNDISAMQHFFGGPETIVWLNNGKRIIVEDDLIDILERKGEVVND